MRTYPAARPAGGCDRKSLMPFPALNAALERALAARGYAEPTPV